MKKIVLALLSILLLTGCSVVRIDTDSIDNILNVILTKSNKLYNQVGQGYKYYLPVGVTYIESDDLNDILYCNGNYYYLYIDAISYYYESKLNHIPDPNAYYFKELKEEDGYKNSGYLEIIKRDNNYYVEFWYNYAKIETMVDEKELNNTVLNSTYILSTMKYNRDIVNLMLKEDYFTNKTGKYNDYISNDSTEKFILNKEDEMKEG